MTQQDPDDWVELPWQPGQRPMWVSQAQLAAILREPPSPFPLGHPLFAGEVNNWHRRSVSVAYPTGTPWLLPDGRPPGVNRQTPLAKNYTWAESWHYSFGPCPWRITAR